MALVEVKVPDIGDFDEVDVIELLVAVGDTVKAEQSLITVESDKASMEIPSSLGGVVKALRVKLGDKVRQGSVVLELEAGVGVGVGAGAAGESTAGVLPPPSEALVSTPRPLGAGGGRDGAFEPPAASPSSGAGLPAGTRTASEGAVPANPPASTAEKASSLPTAPPSPTHTPTLSSTPTPTLYPQGRGSNAGTAERQVPTASLPPHEPTAPKGALPHASPSIRMQARELGVPLDEVPGTGPKNRITPADLADFVKRVMSGAATTKAAAALGSGSGSVGGVTSDALASLLPWPHIDFAKFGPIEKRELTRIQKISGANLHRNWVRIPHVTNHDDADITELEAFRLLLNKEHEKAGIKVTMLAFLIKACVAGLKKFPHFNASLESTAAGDQLVFKQYFHIGFAADTPHGLMVPVIKNADAKGVLQISQEMAELAQKARDGKLSPTEMAGGCISISSLGGIGGRYFTPIINAPEVAILGVCKSSMQPVWDGTAFQPRLLLPLSLSWDHRVIDGASAARFNAYVVQVLGDFRRVIL